MKKSRILSLALSAAMLSSCFTSMTWASADEVKTSDVETLNEYTADVSLDAAAPVVYDFSQMDTVPVYSGDTGYGFESITSSYASKVTEGTGDDSEGVGRQVAPVENIVLNDGAAEVTESDGEYIQYTNSSNYNYGGLVFRADVEPGAYRVTVTFADGTTKDTAQIAVSGMQASRLTSTSAWDNAKLVKRNTSASLSDTTWGYDFVTGEDFIEIEVEPKAQPKADDPQTVGVKSIWIAQIDKQINEDEKPTVFVLGDSTQKTYTFEENSMSGWGQTIAQMFDLDKVNVVNYSMGGRSMKANYQEGRFDDILMTAKPGDYVLIHSAHNDESTGNSAGPEARFGRGSNTATYTNWLHEIYIPSMKVMGLNPVLVTGMPRTNNGVVKSGFNPDSVSIMKAAAEADSSVKCIDLFSAASDYIKAIGAEETKYIYQSLEAGETAGKTNSGSYANGHPDNKIDGTHFKEAYSKQLSRMIAQSIFDQQEDAVMGGLADLLSDNVKQACEDGNWVEHVFPEMANDVSTIGNVPEGASSQGTNAYYRNQIEKVLQLGAMAKDENGNFNPNAEMTVGQFAKSLTELWDLDENVLSDYMTNDVPPVQTTEPVPTVDPSPIQAVKAVAVYDENGRLKSITSEDIVIQNPNDIEIEPVDGAVVYIWNNLQDMEPLCPPIKSQQTVSLSTDISLMADGNNEYVVGNNLTEGETLAADTTLIESEDVTVVTCGDDAPVKNQTGGAFVSSLGTDLRLDGDYDGTVTPKAGCMALLVTPKAAGRIYIDVKINNNKSLRLADSEGIIDEYSNTSGASAFPTVEFDLEAGKTYCVYAKGGTSVFYGCRYVSKANLPTPEPSPTIDPNATPEPAVVDKTPIAADAALTREAMAAVIYDAYLAKFGKAQDGTWNKPVYMTAYNGSNLSPDDPNYDPNLTGQSSQYYPLVGWGALKDTDQFNNQLYGKAKEVYNLGLMRSEKGIERGKMVCGDEMEPKTVVTRAKAAKELYFLYNLIQDKDTENQTIPGENMAFTKVEQLVTPNPDLPSYPSGSTDPSTPPVSPTTQPTTQPGNLPADQAWTVNDAELYSIVTAAGKGQEFGPYNGLSGYGNWDPKGTSADYTHTNGVKYTFNSSWQTGAGSQTQRCFKFTPEQACIVTVAYSSQSGRPLYIYQGDTLLASGEEGAVDGVAATISADIEDISKGDVYIYGGSQNKDIFGIFADYYDPSVIVYRNVSGNINYTGNADTSNMKIVFTDTNDGTQYKVDYGKTYSVELRQNREYNITIEGVDNVCATLDTNSFKVYKQDITNDIDLVDIVDTEVTGEIVTHGLDMSNVTLTFTAQDDNSITKTATITAASDTSIPTATNRLSVVLTPNHKYTVTASGNDGYSLSPLSQEYMMVAGDTAPFKNILFTKDLGDVEYKRTITVGADKDYATVSEAVAAVAAMKDRPDGEDGRVEIVIDPGTYCEQVTVNPSYITFKAADENNKPTITWYYGTGYLYYSAGDNGYYSEDRYVQRTEYGSVSRWGCSVRVVGSNFIAENIIFENSLNCRVTDEELADGVMAAGPGWYGDVSGKPDRTVEGYDAKAQVAVERAAAIAIDRGEKSEFYRCEFISSQDTLYTGGNSYFKECYIEGGTDYIFGGNSVVFEDCTLAWHGYSDSAKGGYITACKTSAVPTPGVANLNANGYIFKDCTVTNSKYYTENKFAAGAWGRNWGGANCQVVFLNTTMDGVDVPGAWTKMGGDLSASILYVDGVTDKSGAPVSTDSTTYNPNGTMAANGYTPLSFNDYFGADWTPVHYTAE